MANYMSQVAKMLGVELSEKFEINENDNWICSFTENQFEIANKNKVYVNASLGEHVLAELIGGVYTIKRKAWVPAEGERYYFVTIDGDIRSDTCDNVTFDALLYKIGNCYRTPEEAGANYDKWMSFYKSDKVLEV